MASINQRIPNFLGGVSQQPDKIKFPGQLRVCDNAVPDITFGLKKRPPAEYIATLTNSNDTGHWYEILRNGDEKFLLQITPANVGSSSVKPIRVWTINDITVVNTGVASTSLYESVPKPNTNPVVNYANGEVIPAGTELELTNAVGDSLFNYLANASKPYSTTTIQDYTLISNPDKIVGTTGTTDAPIFNGDYGYARLDTVAYNTEYILYFGTAPTPKNYFKVSSVKVDVVGDFLQSLNKVTTGSGYSSVPTVTIGAEWAASTFFNTGQQFAHNGNLYTVTSAGGTTTSTAPTFTSGTGNALTYGVNLEFAGKQATATAIRSDGGQGGGISEVEITNPGSGYTSAPTVNFSGGGFTNEAQYTAELASGPTWSGDDPDQQKSGTLTWSFSGGEAVDDTGAKVGGTNITENIEGSLQVNGNSYVVSNRRNYKGSASSSNFLGFTQNYNVRYTATVTLKDGGLIRTETKSQAEGLFVDVTIKDVKYRVSVEAVEPITTYQDVSNIGYYKAPKNPDNGTISMATILNGLKSSINSTFSSSVLAAEVIGSGIFLSGSEASAVNFLGGAVNENMSVIGQKAQDISRLPAMCKHGYVAEISNTADTDVDDYYVKFEANNFDGTNAATAGGSGSWEETVRPHNFAGTSADEAMVKTLDPATMPHALINNRTGTFSFVKLDEATANAQGNQNYWRPREVGDDISNPFPSFNGASIQKMFFHRNRLGLVSGEHVVMSQPSQYFNFNITSAIAVSDDNPIDITVNDTKPAFINHTLPIQKGMMLFSDNGQFLLFTESDIFSPKTARLKKIASYECDSSIQPVDLGTSVLFTSNVSAYARAFEATIVDDDTPPNILEQTRVVPEYLPKDITKSTNSTAIGITTYGKKGDTTVYHYKYYNAGNKREQSAWYTWTLTGSMQHMFYTGGSFFTVTKHENTYKLCKYEYVADADNTRAYVLGTGTVGSPLATSRQFEAHLDNMTIATNVAGSAQSVSATGDVPEKTVLTIPYTPANNTDLFIVGLSGNDSDGNSIAGMVKAVDAVGTNSVTINNINLDSAAKIAVGYKYTSTIELPTYYLNVGQNTYDLDGELRISNMNFEMGVSGPIEFNLIPKYNDMDTYTHYDSGMITEISNYNEPPAELKKSIRVPVQKKSDKFTLQIKIPDPFSTAIISASWDGIYSDKRHVRR